MRHWRAFGRVFEEGPPAPPAWIGDIPIIGESVSSYWQSLALNAPGFLAALGRFTGPAANVALAAAPWRRVSGTRGLSVIIAFFFYLNGRQIAAYVCESTERVAGHRARRLLKLIGSTIKGVIFGLIGTALAQGLLQPADWIPCWRPGTGPSARTRTRDSIGTDSMPLVPALFTSLPRISPDCRRSDTPRSRAIPAVASFHTRFDTYGRYYRLAWRERTSPPTCAGSTRTASTFIHRRFPCSKN